MIARNWGFANIMLIPFRLNRKIRYDKPKKYFKEMSNSENFEEILIGSLITDLNSSGIASNE